jgi:hypothetical protein
MIPNPTPTTFISLILGLLAFIFIMFLPALLELKKPKDAGPRIIIDCALLISPKTRNALIANIEEEQRLDRALAKKIADIIAVLPNMEV